MKTIFSIASGLITFIATKPAYNTLRAEGSIINEMLKDAANDGYMIRAIGIRVRDASNKADFVAEKNLDHTLY